MQFLFEHFAALLQKVQVLEQRIEQLAIAINYLGDVR